MTCYYSRSKKSGTTLFTRKLDTASGGVKVAEEGRKGGSDRQIAFSPTSIKNYAPVCTASAGIGQVSTLTIALGMLQSISDGKATPAVSPCFSGVFLQHAGLICCLLPDPSTHLAHSFPNTTGMLLALGLQHQPNRLS